METPSDHTLYAQWKEDIHPYKVNHFQMNANGSGYTLAETQILSGRTGQTVSGAVKTYTGFTSPAAANTIVTADTHSQHGCRVDMEMYQPAHPSITRCRQGM